MSCAHEAIRLRQSIQPLFVLLLTVVVHRLIQLAPAMLARPLANLYHIRNLSNIIRHRFILPRIIDVDLSLVYTIPIIRIKSVQPSQ